MYRLFKNHNVRTTYEADGLWDFETENGSYKGKLAVPSCWESVPELVNYKGKGIYTKNIYLKGKTRLVFKGVSHTADVYCDGMHIKHHYNAYTPFYADITNCEGVHQIKIVADNAYGEGSALHVENDYYTYGGIVRPLVIEELGDAVINYIHFTPHKEQGMWKGKIDIAIESKCNREEEYELSLQFEGMEKMRKNVALSSGETKIISLELKFDTAEDYSPQNPVLYLVGAVLEKEGKAVDDLVERVGFREIATDGKKLLLNGKPLRILGFNRHESFNSLGCSIPLQAMMRDIALIKETGANSIRTSHYPNDELFLDLCDEMGILVWEEGHARGLDTKKMENPNFIPQSLDCIEEMIENHYNHPSIIMWGILNECVSDTEFGRSCYKALYDKIDSMDKSRPKTSASNKPNTDICLDMEEIVSVNIYPMWYGFNPTGVGKTIDDFKAHMNRTQNGNKPLIISEIGAGAIYGYRNENKCKWSEERQAEILEKQITAVLDDKDVCGVFVWQFCDCRVDESWFYGRPGCNNNKGIVDEFRRKKLAFNVVKDIFNKYKE